VGGVTVIAVLAFIAWLIYKIVRSIYQSFQPPPPPPRDWKAERRKREEAQHEEQNKRRAEERAKEMPESQEACRMACRIATELLGRNAPLIDQFFQVAERKVAVLDDYGDESWGTLDAEILRCIEKIANAEGASVSCLNSKRKGDVPIRPAVRPDDGGGTELERELAHLRRYAGVGRRVVIERSEPYAPEELYRELFYGLEQRFRAYHNQQPVREYAPEQIARMTGVEFENYLMRILKNCGCTVSGTPKTGDKGADIIARFPPDRTIIIQAKRSGAPVGNRAVQEVAAALAYYRGTEAWVVSNSSFTVAARELAQSNRVRLIGGAELRLVAQFLGQPI
jgi:restriction endonuclease